MSFKLNDVGFRYRTSGRTDSDALAGVTAVLPLGSVSAVLGMSGSGKTTLLNLLGRLWDAAPTTGSIRYTGPDGGEFATLSRASTRLRRDRFGFVLQSAFLIGHLTCAENVGVPLALQGIPRADRRRRVEALLDQAGMGGLAARSARRLSGGERQRAAVLRAVVHDPDVLFADEPFSSLDPHNTDLVVALFREWQESGLGGKPRPRTLVLVTHDLPAAWDLVDPPENRRHPAWVPGGFLMLRHGRQVGTGLVPAAELPGGHLEIKRRISPNPPATGGES